MAASVDEVKYSGETTADDLAWRVVIVPRPSRRVAAWIAAVGTLALAATLAAALPPVAKTVVAFTLGCLAIRDARHRAWQKGPGAVRRLSVDLSGRVEVDRSDGRPANGRLVDGSFVAPWLTIVRWRPDGARFPRTILLAPDAVDAAQFRRLRILLRWR